VEVGPVDASGDSWMNRQGAVLIPIGLTALLTAMTARKAVQVDVFVTVGPTRLTIAY
jgi:hypothetical protein